MKYHILFATLFCQTASFAGNFYVNAGAGGFLSNSSSSYTADSSSALYSPTAVGTSLFTLPNVNWKNSFENGINASIASGYRFNPSWRAEVEFFYQNTNRKTAGSYAWREVDATTQVLYSQSRNNPMTQTSSNANVYSFLTNSYYDFKNDSNWTPFVGAGVGVAWMNSNGTNAMNTLNVDDPITPLVESAPVLQRSPSFYGTAFAWQIKAGVDYFWKAGQSLSLVYRLFGTSQFKAGTSWLISNPGTASAVQFTVAQHDVSGILTNALELHYSFDI